MFLKCAQAALAFVCVSASNPNRPPLETANTQTLASPFTASFVTVPRLDCGGSRGSGVRLSDNLIITAAHVTDESQCSAYGAPLRVARVELNRDVSFAEGNLGEGFRALYSCEGIKAGQTYIAMGYAFGEAPNVELLVGTGDRRDLGRVLLKGRVYKGMSGGGIFTEAGVLVAIINALSRDVSYTWVTPLTETYLCS